MKQFVKEYLIEILILIIGLGSVHSFLLISIYQGEEINDPVLAGQFGDLIGGYLGTIFGIFSVVLLYHNIKLQRIAIKGTVDEANFKLIFSEVIKFQKEINAFHFINVNGTDAINKISSTRDFTAVDLGFGESKESIERFEFLLNKFNRLLYLFDNLDTNSSYKDFLSKDIQNIYSLYFGGAIIQIENNWNINEKDRKDIWLHEKQKYILDALKIIEKKIVENKKFQK